MTTERAKELDELLRLETDSSQSHRQSPVPGFSPADPVPELIAASGGDDSCGFVDRRNRLVNPRFTDRKDASFGRRVASGIQSGVSPGQRVGICRDTVAAGDHF